MKKVRNNIVLVTGGTRSGKSSFSLSLAKLAKRPHFVATGWAGDNEMKERIQKHQRERGKKWTTVEERFNLLEALKKCSENKADFVVVDCLTIWISNLMLEGKNWQKEVADLTDKIKSLKIPKIIFVTNEVGLGIVPADKLSRKFRDAAGFTNQKIAGIADEAYLSVCGIQIRLK
ncbi:MAG TPA: bifunctional adenosylcobinamide kinase/adenosylcobinamide-phosphate guanylyltransferase [Victivallales bacterium]|nr:bifunctional adenosylcobinamide kinase/adenosylcobinamide-phosphate guanylyltransferase [Victivallales bacterium]